MRTSSPIIAGLALVLGGCGAKIISQKSAGDGGMTSKPAAQLQYTPNGCNYTVTTMQAVSNAQYLGSQGTPLTSPPLHVHASFAGDPSTTFAVNWKANTGATLVQLFYGTNPDAVAAAGGGEASDAGTNASDGGEAGDGGEPTDAGSVGAADAGPAGATASVQYGHSFDVISTMDGSVAVHVQEAHVCGLTPGTTYYYKVGTTGNFSAVYSLTTAPPLGSTGEFKIGISGDARDDPATFATVEQDLAARGPVVQVFSGDAVDVGVEQYEWDALFEATGTTSSVQQLLAGIPIMTADGNHEQLAANYLSQFALPQQKGGGEDDTLGTGIPVEKAWYSFNYANVHFIILNDSTVNLDTVATTEASWLQNDLASVNRTVTPWIFVSHHQPIYSCDNVHGSDTALGTAWQPLFDQYAVDIVFNGHVHNYQRSNPIRGANVNATSGTVYVVSGAAGAPLYGYNGAGSCAFSNNGLSTTNYTIVDVSGSTVTVTAYDVNAGDVQLDQFTLSK